MSVSFLWTKKRGWTGRGGGGWVKGQWTGVKGAGDGGRRGGDREFFRGGVIPKCVVFLPILLYFYVLQCNSWVSEVSARRIEVNSGIFTRIRR